MDTQHENDISTDDKHLVISKINNYIYLGSCEHPQTDSEEFRNLGIDIIINCAKEIEYSSNIKYQYEKFPIIDGNSISLLENMDDADTKIHLYLSKGKKIYLHCARGMSRSPAILIYYLMMHKQFTYDRAYSLLKQIRPIIDIDPEFENALRSIED